MSTLTAAEAANPVPFAHVYRLPIEPLEHVLTLHGGLAELGLRRSDGPPDTDHGRFVERVTRSWQRARTQGWVSIWVADELCVHLLRVHPSFVYGDAWWDTLAAVDRAKGVADDLETRIPAADIAATA